MFTVVLTSYGESIKTSRVMIDGLMLLTDYISNIASLTSLSSYTPSYDEDACGNIKDSIGNVKIEDSTSSSYEAKSIIFYINDGGTKRPVCGYSQNTAIVKKEATSLSLFLSLDFSAFTNGFLFSSIHAGPPTASHNSDGIVHIENPDIAADDAYSVYSKAQVDSLLSGYAPSSAVSNKTITIKKDSSTTIDTFTLNQATDKTINLGLAGVATSGSYTDLSNKPTIPTVNDTTITIKKNSDDTGDSFTTNASSAKTINLGLSTVATSGSYNDLSNKPTIPTVNNATLTIKKNNSDTGTTFTANASTDVTANLGLADGAFKSVDTSISNSSTSTNIPTSKAVSDFVDAKGYLTQHQSLAGLVASAQYNSTTGKIEFYNNASTKLNTDIDASPFLKDGMIDTVSIVGIEEEREGGGSIVLEAWTDKTPTIKFVRSVTGLSLGDAKALVESTMPQTLYQGDDAYEKYQNDVLGNASYDPSKYTINFYSSVIVIVVKYLKFHYNSDANKQDILIKLEDITQDLEDKLSNVAFSGSYNDLSNRPSIPTVNNATLTINKGGTDDTASKTFSANAFSNVTINLGLATVASSGDYTDLTNTPTIPIVNNAKLTIKKNNDDAGTEFTANASTDVTANLGLSTVATSGSYNDLSNKPTIPTVNDTTITIKKNTDDTGDTFTTNASTAKTINLGLATVATSGSYNDLSNKPTIPTVNNASLTINKGGTNDTTIKTFTANASSNVTINLGLGGAADKAVDTSIGSSSSSNLPTTDAVKGYVGTGTLTIQKNGTTVNSFSANASSNVTANIQVPADLNSAELIGGFVRYNVSGSGNLSIQNVYGLFPYSSGTTTTLPAGTYLVRVRMRSTTSSYTLTVNFGTPYSVSSSNGVIEDVREVTLSSAQGFSASITQVNANTYLRVVIYEPGSVISSGSVGAAAVTNDYNDLDNIPNGTLTIQKNGSNVASFSASNESNVTANITVPTTVASLSDASNYVTTNTSQTISGAKTFTGGVTSDTVTFGDYLDINDETVTACLVLESDSGDEENNGIGVNGCLRPIGNSVYNLGSESNYWNIVYADYLDGTASQASNADYAGRLGSNSTNYVATYTYTSTTNRALIPSANYVSSTGVGVDLGNSSNIWKALYCNSIGTSSNPVKELYLQNTDSYSAAVTSNKIVLSEDIDGETCLRPAEDGWCSIGDEGYSFSGGYFNDLSAEEETVDYLEAGRISVGTLIGSYATCGTDASEQVKDITLEGIDKVTPYTGMRVLIKFSYANTAANPQLRINNDDNHKYYIKRYGTNAVSSANYNNWQDNSIVELVFDGTNWVWVNYQRNVYYASTAGSASSASTATSASSATNASNVYALGKNTSGSYPLVFTSEVNSSTSTTASRTIYTDTDNNIYYNPSTNTLTCPTVSFGSANSASGSSNTYLASFSLYNSDTTNYKNGIQSRGHFLPYTDNDFNLGSKTKEWGEVHSNVFYTYRVYFHDSSSTTYTSSSPFISYYSGHIEIGSDFLPWDTNTYSIGSSGSKFSAVYATTFYGDLSGNATSATSASSATNATNATNATYTNYVNVLGTSSNSVYALVFVSGVNSSTTTSSAMRLYTDTANSVYYNPSSNTLYAQYLDCLYFGANMKSALISVLTGTGVGAFAMLKVYINSTSTSISRGGTIGSGYTVYQQSMSASGSSSGLSWTSGNSSGYPTSGTWIALHYVGTSNNYYHLILAMRKSS